MRKFWLALASLIVLAGADPRARQASVYDMPAPTFWNQDPGAVDCYVNKFSAAATDTANPCGTLAVPRLTIPTGTLAAGTVVAVYGGPGFYAANIDITAGGDLANPVFITGVDAGNGCPLFVGNGIGDNLTLNGSFLMLKCAFIYAARLDLNGSAMVARQVEVFGNLTTACVSMFGSAGVFYQGKAHHCGDSESPVENDFHGIFIAQGSTLSWVLDSEIHHNGGDGIQVGNQNCLDIPLARYNFFGGNTIHEDRENAIDVKCVNDTIASRNIMYGYEATTSSEGAAVVVHDDGTNGWFLNNFILLSAFGVISTESTLFVVLGNILVGTGVTGDTSLFGPSAIHARNTAGAGFYYNTMFGWNSGIATPSGMSGSNECIANIVNSGLFDIRLNGQPFTASLNMVPPTNPLFVAPFSLNYRLQNGSPALNAGATAPSILALYTALYGTTVSTDIYNATRAGIYSVGASQLGVGGPARRRKLPGLLL